MSPAFVDPENMAHAVWEDSERVFYRGWRHGPGNKKIAVLVVAPFAEPPTPGSLDRLAHEYGLKDELDSLWAVRPLELLRERGRTLLVFEDTAGEPLEQLLGRPMDSGQFLRLAIGITTALGHVHRRGLIHKDIKPANVLVDLATGHVRLMGFGVASRLPRERQPPEPIEVIDGTLAYMAPEQTGRMNRSVDSRSDLYALGVTFYQMLTGSLPFTATDAMELLHCHIARRAVPPAERVPGLSPVLSAIVMRLLAKTAEDRYQTAAGVAEDLRRCLRGWEETGQIDNFPLGGGDIPHALRIPERLYGREREVAALHDAFDRMVSRGTPELILVSGYSGIGKSSVINELHKVIVPPRGIFASGKFDQYQRDIPYATLAQAFTALVRQLLVHNEDNLTRWRASLLTALGPSGRLVTDLVPDLELLIGPQPPVPELPPGEAENRFLAVLEGFLGVFARPEHPLVLFLDDLQWLDAATLKFLAHVVTPPKAGHLLAIGAYRDNDVGPTHPLMLTLEPVRKAGAIVQDIVLGPLTHDDICRMVAESLSCSVSEAEPLSRLVHDKTAGNPFFAIQFLMALWDEKLLAFDPVQGSWVWSIDDIDTHGFTDNVVDLMVAKLRRYPEATQEALQQFACLGNRADVAFLAVAQSGSEEAVHTVLWEAVRDAIVLRGANFYRFLHDRVQEAAYALIPVDQRAEKHLQIGRLLLWHLPPETVSDRVFDVVNQLNRGAALIRHTVEKATLRRLNTLAGRRAKTAIAYASARNYFDQAASLLPANAWRYHYDEIFALQLERSECEYVTGHVDAAEVLFRQSLANARDRIDAAKIYRLRMDLYQVSGRTGDAVKAAVEALGLFGITFPEDEEEIRAAADAALRQIPASLGDRRIADVLDSPPATDPETRAIIGLLAGCVAPSYIARPVLYPLIVANAVNLSLTHGSTEESCHSYIHYAIILGALFGDIESGYEFSEMTVRLNDKFNDRKRKGEVLEEHGACVSLWSKPLETSIGILRDSISLCLEVGQMAFVGYGAISLVWQMLEKGDTINVVFDELTNHLSLAQQSNNSSLHATLSSVRAFLTRMRGQDDTSDTGDGEGQWLRVLQDADYSYGIAIHYVVALTSAYMFGRTREALEYAEKAEAMRSSMLGLAYEFTLSFYYALTLAWAYPRAGATEQQRWKTLLEQHLAKLQLWEQTCPETFENRVALVMAEIARIEGRNLDAMRLYEKAIRVSRENGFIQIEALANELAGRFYLDRQLEKNGFAHLRDALACYTLWGADGMVRHLEHFHPRLALSDIAATTVASMVRQVDLTAVARASQALASEIVLPKLIETLMTIALQNAGADRGLLILPRDGTYAIEAEAFASGNAIEVAVRQTPINRGACPEALLRYVIRTQESVILDDTSKPNLFSGDAYLQQGRPRSIHCLPLLKQGRLAGLIYLENTLTTHAFTSDRVAVLELLAARAAISLENTRLYNDLQEREARIRRLVDSNIIGIIIWDFGGRIIEANDAFLNMVGYKRDDLAANRLLWTELTDAIWRDVDEPALAELRVAGSVKPREKEYTHKDGHRVPVLVGAATFGDRADQGVAFVLDLTERKRADAALHEAQADLARINRITTVGELAATIAHEVNQPLTGLVSSGNACLRWLSADPPNMDAARRAVERMISDGTRAGEVIRRIREMLRKSPPQRNAFNVNETIEEVLALARSEFNRKSIALQIDLSNDLPLILGDRIQLQQVIINLIVNAVEAMSDTSVRQRQLSVVSTKHGEDQILVAIRDTGKGLDQDLHDHLFDAFYTTKPDGMGMGLAISRTIVERHGGTLWAAPNTPHGAVFQFTLPTADAAIA